MVGDTQKQTMEKQGMIGYLVLLFFLLGVVCEEPGSGASDACYNYWELNEGRRSTGYHNDAMDHLDFCDRSLAEGWYRSISPAGGDMPTSAPGFNKCGTVYPIWLRGELPENEGDVVEGEACITGVFSDCASTLNITIKNCGDFNVYFLLTSYACPESYCFGNESKCPPGFRSPTGYTPGCDGRSPPVLSQDPTLSFEVITRHVTVMRSYSEIVFLCDIDTPDIEEKLWYDVTFFIGEERIFFVVCTEDDLPARLPEGEFSQFQDKKHEPNFSYGNNLRCYVQARWTESEDPGYGRETEEYYGFELISQSPIEIEEGESAEIRVRSKLPIDCPTWDPYCEVLIELLAPKYQDNIQRCRAYNGRRHLILVKTGCTTPLQGGGSNEVNVTVQAEVDPTLGKGNKDMVVKMYSDQQGWKPALSNLALPPVTILVKDGASRVTGMRCYAVCDPHMALFDRRRWEGQFYSGIFILYRNLHTDTEVQIRLTQCNRAATCACAVMVRAGKSVYVLDTCDDRYQIGGYTKYPPRSKLYDCDEGRSDMLIEHTGNKYKFTFPSSTVVDVYFQAWAGYHNVYVTPSAADYQRSDGMCGHIYEKNKASFALRDGKEAGNMKVFMGNWRVTDEESLWQGKSANPETPVYYCGCSEKAITCEATQEHWDCVDKVFNNKQYDICRATKRKRRSAIETRSFDIVDDDNDIVITDPVDDLEIDETPEWKNNWTETTARQHCEEYILSRSSVQACGEVPNIDPEGAIDTCVLDIKILGDTSADSSSSEAVINQCMMVTSRNLSLWEQEGNETMIPPHDIVDAVCINNCNDRGQCVEGACVCEPGFSGADCGQNDTAVPNLYRLPYSGLCDLQKWSCHETLVYGTDLTDSDDLACQVQTYEVTASGMTETGEKQTYSSYQERESSATCSLAATPTTVISTMAQKENVLGLAYGIQMSNDGQHFSEPLIMVAFDPKCANCSNVGYSDVTCEENAGICKIGGECYADQERNPENFCQLCDISKSTTTWYTQENSCFIGGLCYNENDPKPQQSCLRCKPQNSGTTWTRLDNTCLISGVCYSNGASNPDNVCQTCQPSLSPTSWSIIQGCGAAVPPVDENAALRLTPATMVITLLSMLICALISA